MFPLWLSKILQKDVPEIATTRTVSPEQVAGFCSRLWFSWLSPLMDAGYKRPLERNDIWTVPDTRQIGRLETRLHDSFRRRAMARCRWPLLFAIYDVSKVDFWHAAFSQFIVSTLQVTTPFTLRFLIQWVQNNYFPADGIGESSSVAVGIGYVIGITAMQLIQNLGTSHFHYRGTLLGGQTRSTLIALAFTKSLKLSNRAKAGGESGIKMAYGSWAGIPPRTDTKGWSNGRVMNLISTDTARVEQALAVFHLSWLSLYQLLLTVALLIYNLGWTALTGAATLILGLAAVTYTTRPLAASRARINKVTDQRVTITQEMLQSIRFIKYFSWESFFHTRLTEIRARETRALQTMHLIRCAVGTLAAFLPAFAILITFAVFAVVHGQLDAAVIFSSLAMLYLLRIPTNWLPVSISLAADAVQSVKRLEDYLLAEEVETRTSPNPDLVPAVQLRQAAFTWESLSATEATAVSQGKTRPNRLGVGKLLRGRRALVDTSAAGDESGGSEKHVHEDQNPEKPFGLTDVSFEYGRGELIGIIGSVGSGKSSLLGALAGDMRLIGGSMEFFADRAYCPQYAWIQSASIRDNIIFGKPYDQALYSEIIQACALVLDFQILPHGDLTEIGERGVTLSGGQKQRINIARAIYSDAGIILLDDPLSSVDANVGTHIFNEAICRLLQSKTRFLATHQLHLLSRFDKIIWMDDGKIMASGTYDELVTIDPAFLNLVTARGYQQHKDDMFDEKRQKIATLIEEDHGLGVRTNVLIQEEARIIDSVPLSVYVSWLRASGSLWSGAAMLTGQTLFRSSNIVAGLWLSWWVDNKYGLTRDQNIGIYAGLSMLQGVLMFTSSLITCLICTRSSRAMSNEALWLTLRAPMSLFDTTPLGRIIYRFTRDIDTLDNNLVVAVQQLLINGFSLVGSYVLIVAYFYYFIIVLLIGVLFLWWIISYYRSSSRELRRHQLTLDGVVFAHFNEALFGAVCIRAYNREPQFVKLVHQAIDDMDSANFLGFASHNWLSVRLDNIGIFLSFVTGLLIVTNSLPVSPSISGLLLTYSLSMVGIMQTVVKYLIEANNSMSNTERLLQYTSCLGQEAPLKGEPVRSTWPENGSVEYKGVQMRYRPGLPLVVDDFSLGITGGERIGIVGRAGAGKSTILSTLFRLTEISGGSITIDGVDISQIGLHRLRSSLAIIPQDPTLFAGTIRSNLDPFKTHTDLELWDSLREAYLLPAKSALKSETNDEASLATEEVTESNGGDEVEAAEAGITLDSPVEAEGLNFSLGQRQLIALARALLRNTRIVLVDEGTSSVDPETDARVQQTLTTGLKGKTLVAIAHRLRTVIQYDRVCVMDRGKIVELGPPLDLWEEGGLFRTMCDSNGIRREMFFS